MSSLEVVEVSGLTLIQDEGRHGLAALGVTRSGAADRGSYRLGGRLVGNPPGLAALEVIGRLAVRARGDVMYALTGADPRALRADRPAPWRGPSYLRDGDTLVLNPAGMPTQGLRSYLCVRGGFAIPQVLGSCATDVLSGLGPSPVRTGQVLALGAPPRGDHPQIDLAPPSAPQPLSVLPGPRGTAPTGLFNQTWTVSADSNRVGVRLSGSPLTLDHPSAVPSEGVVRGSIQLPPNGLPLIFGPDHPVTGGYPVIGVLTEAASDALAQLPPGASLRFHRP